MSNTPVSENIRSYALEQVGAAYIMGATAVKCTPKYRRSLAEGRSSAYADKIIDNCPVLSGKQSSCEGCKYESELSFDCAQLTRFAAQAAGLHLPSGATSQWNKGDWLLKGTIDQLPEGYVAFLYRRKKGSTSTMSHTGICLGNGTVVDARGHDDGVRHDALAAFPWTHFAILAGMDAPSDLPEIINRPTIRQGSKGEDVRQLQRSLRSLGYALEIDGHFGPLTAQCVKSFQGDADLTRDGVVGPLTWSALDTALRADRYTVTIGGLTESTAKALTGQYGGEMRLEGGDAA